MIVKLFLVADEYSDKGFKVQAVDVADEWHVNYYKEKETAIELQEVQIGMPDVSKLVALGMEKIDSMKQELAENVNNCNRRIKEFEAKFMQLEHITQEDEDTEPADKGTLK